VMVVEDEEFILFWEVYLSWLFHSSCHRYERRVKTVDVQVWIWGVGWIRLAIGFQMSLYGRSRRLASAHISIRTVDVDELDQPNLGLPVSK